MFLSMLRHETARDPQRAAAALAGLRAYQAAVRVPRPADPPIVARAGRAQLFDYGTGAIGRTVVFVPSLINAAAILDLLPERSMLRWLSGQGIRPLLVDWGVPDPAECELSVAGHIEGLLLPMLRAIGSDFALAGYCLGGTMAVAAACCLPVRGVALIVAPWRFSGFPDDARAGLRAIWDRGRPIADALGTLPLELLQAGFWSLDPARTIDKFVTFGASRSDPAATRLFVALEDWANAGAPLTAAAGRELIEDLFGRDVSGEGRWRVAGRIVDPALLACPVLDIVSSVDRIVPAASAAGIGTTMTLPQGHVGMVMGSRAQAMLWEPLARWLRDPHIG